jgi:RNA polymerase sigma-70 factor, ECF subfamily
MENRDIDPFLLELAAGTDRAYSRLYDDYAGRLYRVAISLVGRPEEAEDAVQDVFVALIRSRQKLPQVQNLTAYLFASLRRAAGSRSARRARQPVSLEAVGEVADDKTSQAAESPHSERLDRALNALPAEQREVIVMKIDAELTFAEIGQILGVSANTAASRYRYALEKLRMALRG